MPIKFRCVHCRQFLGISPARAGELTDCPACGRTVRVPNLDGTVSPLPPARIDPGDQQLADALSALSRIAASTPPCGMSAATTALSAPVVVAAGPRSAAPIAVAVPTPTPLPPERVVPAPVSLTAFESQFEPVFELDAPLDEPIRTVVSKPRTAELKIMAGILVLLAVFLSGFFTGRMAGRPGNESESKSSGQSGLLVPVELPPAQRGEAAAAPVAVAGFSGTVTWQSADGQTRGDGGARVIALPVDRPASPPLHVTGFRAGAVPTDRERAIAEIRAAGGDYTVADDAGRFSLELAAGRYEVLFVSRHQSRDNSQPLEPEVVSLLAAYFDQPAGLVGSVGVAAAPAEFDGTSLRLDHGFSR